MRMFIVTFKKRYAKQNFHENFMDLKQYNSDRHFPFENKVLINQPMNHIKKNYKKLLWRI